MKKIILGKEGDQYFTINGSSVSRQHAEVTINDNGIWTLTDLNSTNGTFVRDEQTGVLKRISQIEIHPLTFICLGPDNSHGCSFYARQVLNPGDFKDELEYMNEKEDEYDKELVAVERKIRWQRWIVFFLNVGVAGITLLIPRSFDSVITDFRLNIMRIVPICSTFFSAFYDFSGEKKKLAEQYNRFRHCPNPECHNKLKSTEIRSMDCSKCHCM